MLLGFLVHPVKVMKDKVDKEKGGKFLYISYIDLTDKNAYSFEYMVA